MSDLARLGEHFIRKASAVGTVVTRAADREAARGTAGHESGDRVADGLFGVVPIGRLGQPLGAGGEANLVVGGVHGA